MLKKLYNWLISRFGMFVIADAKDNSITLSQRLFNHMAVMKQKSAKVYVFYIPDVRCYGFVLNPSLDKETQLCEIQYNEKHHCVGFESLVPSVNRIFYDYGLPADICCRLSVRPRQVGKLRYYKICRPNGKYPRKLPKA